MLMIGAKDDQLKQWTVTDPQGYDTTVAVYNLDTSKHLDPSMFKIDFTNYSTPGLKFILDCGTRTCVIIAVLFVAESPCAFP